MEEKKIRILKNVCSDIPFDKLAAAAGSLHEPHYNPKGAVYIIIDGRELGLKPDEYEYIKEKVEE